jgi:hypothetical protein
MIEKIKRIQNPLTIIAIFAAIAEISGTIILPFIQPDNQGIYIWFLMLFPVFLVILFFLTLNLNYKVLYAPSDFRDEDNFLKLFNKSDMVEKVTKLNEELAESEQEDEQENEPEICNEDIKTDDNQNTKFRDIIRRNVKATYLLAEELTINKLTQEFGNKIEREMMLNVSNSRFMFDGVVTKGNKYFAIEIKYFKDKIRANIVKKTLKMIERVFNELDENTKKSFHLVLAVTTECNKDEIEKSKKAISEVAVQFQFPVLARFYNLSELEKEFGFA